MLTIPDPGFAGDDGTASPELAAALDLYAQRPGHYPEVVGILQRSRLLVPVVAILGEVEYDEQGLAHDKSSEMATVLVQKPDGRKGMLAFTGTESMKAWNEQARPVPAPTRRVAQAAVNDEATALVIDIAGPVTFVVEGVDLTALADGFELMRVADGFGWVKEES